MHHENFPLHIAIIGAGFSGTLVAVHLLRSAPAGTRIALIERTPPAGRGVAYRGASPDHLLNVAADKMGAFADRPEDFLDWVRSHLGEPGFPVKVQPTDYLPRELYGRYIAGLLSDAVDAVGEDVSLVQVEGEVVDLEEAAEGGGVLHFSDGRRLRAEQVVLALGNLPGSYPIPRPLKIYQTSRYVHVPWNGDALNELALDEDILLVDQGLTASDLIVELARRGHRGTVHALSRNGQRPQVHEAALAYPCFLEQEPMPTTTRALVHRVRAELRIAAARGVNWRAVIDSLRPFAQTIWQTLSWEERARFMRHVRPFWEGHRHRVAPQLAAILEQMIVDGRLQLHAGRLQTLDVDDDGVTALFRRRGSIQHVSLRVARVINCTGPRTDYSKYQHPLYIHLLARGLIDHDPLALGIAALPTGEVLRYRGEPAGWLFTLGAPLKGVLWETTAVREIRVQAQALAGQLLENRVGAVV